MAFLRHARSRRLPVLAALGRREVYRSGDEAFLRHAWRGACTQAQAFRRPAQHGVLGWKKGRCLPRVCLSAGENYTVYIYTHLRNPGWAGPFLRPGPPQVLTRPPRYSRRAGPFLQLGPPQVVTHPPWPPRGFSEVPRRCRQDSKHPQLTDKPPRQPKMAPRRSQKTIICQRNPQRGPGDLKIVKNNRV